MKLKPLWLFLPVLGLAATPAPAQTSDFDNYCRVGSIRTCASVRLLTTWDPVTLVTRVQLWVRNLQGSLPNDNTGGAPITRVGLTQPTIRYPAGFGVTTIDNAVTVGNPAPYWKVTNQSIEGPVTFSAVTTLANGSTTPEGGIQGCNIYPANVTSYFQTCGTGWVIFSFTTRNQWDAADGQIAWKVFTTAADGKSYYACRTAADPTTGEYCDPAITETTVTPEPVSMALLGTGLFGLGALRRRRRRAGLGDIDAAV